MPTEDGVHRTVYKIYGPCGEGVVLSNSYKETWNRCQETWVRLLLDLTSLGLSLILAMDLYLTVLDQDSGLKGIRLNLDGEKWLLLFSVHTLVYRDRNTPIHTHTHTHIIHSHVLCKFETCWMAASRNTSGHFQCLPRQQPELSHPHLLINQLVQVKTMFHNCSEETLPKNLPSVSDDVSR